MNGRMVIQKIPSESLSNEGFYLISISNIFIDHCQKERGAIRVPFPTRLLPKNGKMKGNIERLNTHTNLLSKCKHRWKSIEQIGSTTQRMDTDNVTTHIVKVHFQFEN